MLYLLLMLLYTLVMCLVFTADATVYAGKGPSGSSNSVQNKFDLLNILKDKDSLIDFMCLVFTANTTVHTGKGPSSSTNSV